MQWKILNNNRRKSKLTILLVVSRTGYCLSKQVTKTHSSSSTTSAGCCTEKLRSWFWERRKSFFVLSDRKSLLFLLDECLFCESKKLEGSALLKTLAGSVLEFGGVRRVFIVAWKLEWKPKLLLTPRHVHTKVRYMTEIRFHSKTMWGRSKRSVMGFLF